MLRPHLSVFARTRCRLLSRWHAALDSEDLIPRWAMEFFAEEGLTGTTLPLRDFFIAHGFPSERPRMSHIGNGRWLFLCWDMSELCLIRCWLDKPWALDYVTTYNDDYPYSWFVAVNRIGGMHDFPSNALDIHTTPTIRQISIHDLVKSLK